MDNADCWSETIANDEGYHIGQANETYSTKAADAYHLQRWAYAVDDDSLTVAERLEKLNWEAAKKKE